MKRFATFLLLLGYLLLVPFCFFGTSISPSGNMTHHQAMGMEMPGMESPCCGNQAGTDALAQHSVMYLVFTGTPSTSTVLLFTMVFVFVFGLNSSLTLTYLVSLVNPNTPTRKRRKTLYLLTQKDFLSWLSQNETSPTFA